MKLRSLVGPQPCTVDVDGVAYTVRAADAAEWLGALTSDLHVSVVPGLLESADRAALVRLVMTGKVPSDAVWQAAQQAIEEVSGYRWWQALRLAGYAEAERGVLYGRLLLAGVRPDGLSFPAWCAAMFAMITQHMDETARTKFDAAFLMPPDGDVTQVDDWDTGIPEGWS